MERSILNLTSLFSLRDGIHSGIPPDKEFVGFVDPEGWHLLKTSAKLEDKGSTTYEYDSRRSVNDVLKAIADAN